MLLLLLDTHSLVWWLRDDPRLPERARALIAHGHGKTYVSAASAWEIATKVRLGKLPQMEQSIHCYEEDVKAEGFLTLAIQQHHSLKAGLLGGTHGDPFDRILAAQALIEELTVVTRDRAFAAFGCKVVW